MYVILTIHLRWAILGLNSGCEIFDEAGANVSGNRHRIIDDRVGREMVPSSTPGSAKRAGRDGDRLHTIEKSENAGSQF